MVVSEYDLVATVEPEIPAPDLTPVDAGARAGSPGHRRRSSCWLASPSCTPAWCPWAMWSGWSRCRPCSSGWPASTWRSTGPAKTVFGTGFDTGLWLCIIWLVALIAATTFADLLPLGVSSNTEKTLGQAGNLRPDLFSAHPLGTNNFALDLLSRCIYAARVSLLTSAFAVVVSLLIGGTIGMIAGYYRGWLDRVVGVLTDSFLAFPALILLIAIAAVLGIPKSVPSAILKEGSALAVVGIPTMIRLSRANTLAFAQREFVVASRAMGASDARIIRRDILPNVILPLISFSFIVVAVLIVAEGSLAFLGLGLQQPLPTWGNMIAEGDLTTIRQYPFIPLVPGMFMFLTVFSFNRVGERARSLWDPRKAKI